MLQSCWFWWSFKISLQHFCHVSELGYGQCRYIKMVSKEDKFDYFLPGKAKLKPNRFAFILSLNITTATFSVKVESWLKKNWIRMRLISGSGRTAKYFYATLLKIYGGLRYFFANRLQQIEDNTTSGQWFCIQAKGNPANDT